MTTCFVCVCVWGWKGLSPSVKKSTDTQKSPSGPNRDTEGDTSVTKTGTAVVDCCASVHSVSEDVVFAVINSLAKTMEVDQILAPHICNYHFSLVIGAS